MSDADTTVIEKTIIPPVKGVYERSACLERRSYKDGSIALIGLDQENASLAWTATYRYDRCLLPKGQVWVKGSFVAALMQANILLPCGDFRTIKLETGDKFQIHRCELLD